MDKPASEMRSVEIGSLGERLSSLRLCEAGALETVRRSLAQHGQLSAVTLFGGGEQLEILDGFKRVRAARALGLRTLLARIDNVSSVEAKLRLCELQVHRGLTELEEGWLVRSLYREDRLSQPEIAQLMSRHKSWVWRRLMLVEALAPTVQADVRLGLIVARAAVAVSRLPRGNQQAASMVVMRRGLTESVRRSCSSTRRSLKTARLQAPHCWQNVSKKPRLSGRPGLARRVRCATRRTG